MEGVVAAQVVAERRVLDHHAVGAMDVEHPDVLDTIDDGASPLRHLDPVQQAAVGTMPLQRERPPWDAGPLGQDRARAELLAWWDARGRS